MAISVFDLFSIGIGPSSSHTVGPMRAALQFLLNLIKKTPLENIDRIVVDLYGSLALTGKGHSTDIAILLGLEGDTPEGTDPNEVLARIQTIRESGKIALLGTHRIDFQESTDLIFQGDKQLPFHPNAMRFRAFKEGKELFYQVIYSLGGGFIIDHETAHQAADIPSDKIFRYPFNSADELLALCKKNKMTIAELVWENERAWRSDEEIRKGILNIWHVMKTCTERGCQQEGILPGGLKVKRRAHGMYNYLKKQSLVPIEKRESAEVMDWVSLWALAVNEENAAGGRVVTAPTNGSAGVIPAVLHYYEKFTVNPSDEGIITFFLTAAAIGVLYKKGASISAAEMGCMGEVGVACSMAAAGLAAALGATNEQVENAAEIGMEHHLGMTCDPIMGLVQIPCIERNTMGANKAINAERLARLHGNGEHRVSLDQVIATMKQTGDDMKSIYKETSLGGLAVNVPAC
jgi:L-serine dehydratase